MCGYRAALWPDTEDDARSQRRIDWYLDEVSERKFAICDLDGTLLDSDSALVDAFLTLGVGHSEISYGHVIAEECMRLGISLHDYVEAYDTEAAQPFAGVGEVIDLLEEWAICSNKHVVSGRAELVRLDWHPSSALFSDAFNGPKRLAPLLENLNLDPSRVIFVGDTDHDRRCAQDAGVAFAIAAWNPRAVVTAGDIVLEHPSDLIGVLGL